MNNAERSPENDGAQPIQEILSASDVHKDFRLGGRTIAVLRGISLSVPTGAFLALQGASGAGKSTLLHLLGALDLPTRGSVRFRGKNLSQMPESERSRTRNASIGFVFQAYHLLPELTALENVCLPARLARRPSAPTTNRARDLLGRVGLGDRLHHRPYELSGGEQQRVAIARALINQPEVLLADEPTGNLDSRTGEEIIELLCGLRVEFRTTLIVATHDAKVAQRAPFVCELLDGHLLGNSKGP